MILRPLGLLLLSLALVAPLAYAQEDERPQGTLNFVVENDLFYDVDRHYTNGVRIAWVPDQSRPVPEWARDLAGLMPWYPESKTIRYGYAFGQSLFTPSDIEVENPARGERPYAGWLYGAIGLGVERGRVVDQFGLSIGVVGPAALGEQTQKFVHKHIGSPKPLGWDTQLKNELGVVATWQRSWQGLARTRLLGHEADFSAHSGIALGNVFTYFGSGFMLRFGPSLPNDYGPPRIQPGLPGSSDFAPPRSFRWYAFAGAEGRAVGRNIFLDGNTFRDSRSVDKRRLVGDVQVGVVLDWRDARVAFTHVWRSREFHGQDGSDKFSAISLSFKL
ncbi:MAG: lipid A deacylase LpxR family protein [Azoarcus sp.]|nr:lipid A deacylase LpxR family protein [Azoarcus sp.]